jgi:hypothetical protein
MKMKTRQNKISERKTVEEKQSKSSASTNEMSGVKISLDEIAAQTDIAKPSLVVREEGGEENKSFGSSN